MAEWSIRKALICLIGSTFLTLIVTVTGFSFWKKHQKEKKNCLAYQIKAIIQTGPEKEALTTAYLAEVLGLSSDQPTQSFSLNLQKAKAQLLASPLIANAKIKRIPPTTLYIDYEVRKPLGLIADFQNTAFDAEGYLFPVAPFLTPKRLPEIYLGISTFPNWHIEHPGFTLALEILHFLEKTPWTEGLSIQRIDVSNAFAPSLGTREVVLLTEEELNFGGLNCSFPKILRLAPKDYEKQLTHFFSLRKSMMEDYKKQLSSIKQGSKFAPRIIDLRIPQLAFVEKG